MKIEPGYRRLSATVPADFLEEIKSAIPKGEFSAWVYEALKHQREQDNLAELVHHLEEVNGPVTPDELQQVETLFR
jgi:hypothetical protein